MGIFRTATRSLALIPLLATMAGHAADNAPGLIGEYFKDKAEFLPANTDMKPYLVRVDKKINFDEVNGNFYKSKLAGNFSVRWSGVIKISEAGTYSFSTESDDGSRLSINGKEVVYNGCPHAMTKKSGTVELTAGEHPILIEYFQGGGGAGCKVSWKAPGGDEQPISESVLAHDKSKLAAISWDQAAWKKDKAPGGGGGGPSPLTQRWPAAAIA